MATAKEKVNRSAIRACRSVRNTDRNVALTVTAEEIKALNKMISASLQKNDDRRAVSERISENFVFGAKIGY